MHNLGTIIKFEVIKAVKKKSFWFVIIGSPLIFGVIVGIIFLSNQASSEAAKELAKQSFSAQIVDESKIINPKLAQNLNIKTAKSKEAGQAAVKRGEIEAFFYFPKDIAKEKVEITAKDVGLFENSRYEEVAKVLMSMSVEGSISPQIQTILQNKVTIDTQTFRDGKPYDSVKEMIAPGAFLIIFYLLIAFFSGQMLTSMTEEKENRIIEMLLTTVKSRTLVTGKIISLIAVVIIQAILLTAPPLIAYILFKDRLTLPGFDLSTIPLDPARIAIGAVIFFLSFLMFTGLLVAISAAMPTAKEATSFSGIIFILIFGPLYAAPMFITSPGSLAVQILSIFPLTSPIPLLIRNAVGNLTTIDILVSLSILALFSVAIIALAVRIFHYGVLEYSSKLSLKSIFKKKTA